MDKFERKRWLLGSAFNLRLFGNPMTDASRSCHVRGVGRKSLIVDFVPLPKMKRPEFSSPPHQRRTKKNTTESLRRPRTHPESNPERPRIGTNTPPTTDRTVKTAPTSARPKSHHSATAGGGGATARHGPTTHSHRCNSYVIPPTSTFGVGAGFLGAGVAGVGSSS